MTTKTIKITEDFAVTHSRICKLICSCGWYDKFYEKECLGKAEAHLKSKHNGGLIHYRGAELEVTGGTEVPHQEARRHRPSW